MKISYRLFGSLFVSSLLLLATPAFAEDEDDEKNVSHTPSAEVVKIYERGLAQMKKKRYKSAMTFFASAINKDSKLSGPHVNRGIIFYNFEDYISADAEFKWAVQKNPKRKKAYLFLGLIAKQKGKFKNSKEYYEKAIGVDDEYQMAYYNLGILCDLFLKDVECALNNYKKYHDLTDEEDKNVGIWIATKQIQWDQIVAQRKAEAESKRIAEEEASLTPEQRKERDERKQRELAEQKERADREAREAAEKTERERKRAEEEKAEEIKEKLEKLEQDKKRLERDRQEEIEEEREREEDKEERRAEEAERWEGLSEEKRQKELDALRKEIEKD